MRFEGTITNWKDSEGYGFIAPTAGGEEVFVHIKSFESRKRRPSANDVVTYEIGTDAKGRSQAQRVVYADQPTSRRMPFAPARSEIVLVGAFFLFLAGAAFAGRLPMAFVGPYAMVSAIAFAAYAIDKSAAIRGRRRIPEATLHLLALLGGWPGALAAQSLFRHKTRKLSFRVVFWITVLLNIGTLVWLLSPAGAPVMRGVLEAIGANT